MTQQIPSVARRTYPRALLIIFAFVLLLVASIPTCYAYARLTATTTGEIRALVSENLPPGSTSDEIEEFLDEQGIDHGPVERLGNYGFDREFDYPPNTLTLHALVRDTANYLITTVDIDIVFFLDTQLHLVDFVVFETYSSI